MLTEVAQYTILTTILRSTKRSFENLITPRPLITNISGLGLIITGNAQEGPDKQGPSFFVMHSRVTMG